MERALLPAALDLRRAIPILCHSEPGAKPGESLP